MRPTVGSVSNQVGGDGAEQKSAQLVLFVRFAAQRLQFGLQVGVIFQNQFKLAVQIDEKGLQLVRRHDSLQ